MITAVALVVYIAAAFFGEETRYAVFEDKAACQAAVERVRSMGGFATDCQKVEFSAPKNGSKS